MRTDLIARGTAPLAALVCLLAGAPRPVTGGLALLGLALAAERLVDLRRTGLADRLLVGVGGVLVVLVLTGPVLDASGAGLRPTTWVVALVVLAALGLGLAAVVPPRPESPVASERPDPGAWGRSALRTLPWAAVAVVVTVLAVRMTTASVSEAEAAPLQLSLGDVSGTSVEVVVTTSEAVGPLELRTANRGNETSYPLITLEPGASSTTTIDVPSSGRFVITLNYPDQTEPLRKLVLDR